MGLYIGSKASLYSYFGAGGRRTPFWQDKINARKILPSDALGFHNTSNGSKTLSSFLQ